MKWLWPIVGMIVLLVLGVPLWISVLVAAVVWFITAIAQSATGDGNRSNRNDNTTFQNINRTTTRNNNHAATRDNKPYDHTGHSPCCHAGQYGRSFAEIR